MNAIIAQAGKSTALNLWVNSGAPRLCSVSWPTWWFMDNLADYEYCSKQAVRKGEELVVLLYSLGLEDYGPCVNTMLIEISLDYVYAINPHYPLVLDKLYQITMKRPT